MNPEQMIGLVEGLADLDFDNTPTLVFTTKLRDNLVSRNYLSLRDANRLVTTMEIELGQTEFSDEQMTRMVEAFTEVLRKSYVSLRNRGFNDEDFVRLASRFNLKVS